MSNTSKVIHEFATSAGLEPCGSADCILGFRGGQTVGLCHCAREIVRRGPCSVSSVWFSNLRRMLRAMATEIAELRGEDGEDTCESGLPDCGEVAAYDSENVPLCARCYEELKKEQGCVPL